MEVPYTRFDDIEEMNNSIADGNIYIMSSWNDINQIPAGALHTYMVYAYTEEDGAVVLKTHNKKGNGRDDTPYSEFSILIGHQDGRFICGYLIGKSGRSSGRR